MHVRPPKMAPEVLTYPAHPYIHTKPPCTGALSTFRISSASGGHKRGAWRRMEADIGRSCQQNNLMVAMAECCRVRNMSGMAVAGKLYNFNDTVTG